MPPKKWQTVPFSVTELTGRLSPGAHMALRVAGHSLVYFDSSIWSLERNGKSSFTPLHES